MMFLYEMPNGGWLVTRQKLHESYNDVRMIQEARVFESTWNLTNYLVSLRRSPTSAPAAVMMKNPAGPLKKQKGRPRKLPPAGI